MSRRLGLPLLVLAVSLMMARVSAAQTPEIKGWNRIKFGMTWKQIRAAYPDTKWNEKRTAFIITNPADGVLVAICQFGEMGGCRSINLILDSTDFADVLKSLRKKYGPPPSHEQRFSSEWYFWSDAKGAVICAYPITATWLAQSRLSETPIAGYEGHAAMFYSQKGGLAP